LLVRHEDQNVGSSRHERFLIFGGAWINWFSRIVQNSARLSIGINVSFLPLSEVVIAL
jgi:hypothetical protein